MDSNQDGNHIRVINLYLDRHNVPTHAPGFPLATYTTWGRIFHVVDERDRLRRRVQELEEAAGKVVNYFGSGRWATVEELECLRKLVR